MNAVSVDIKDMLDGESTLGLAFKDNLFIGKEPTSPEEGVTIFDTPGGPPSLPLDSESYYYDSIQIRVRSREYVTGWTLAHQIMLFLHGQANMVINSTYYAVIYCSSGPALLDWDERGRARFIINFEIQRRKEANYE